MMREPPSSTLFPYPSLFRSEEHTSELQSHSHLVCLEFSRVHFRSDRKSTRLNSSHTLSTYAVLCLKKTTRGSAMCSRPAPPSWSSFRSTSARSPSLFFLNESAPPELPPLSLRAALRT